MLTRFSVKNYKCLADVSLPLTPLHVLIGQNDAGKTSLLEAMYGFFRSSEYELSVAFPGRWEGRDLVFHGASSPSIEFTGEWNGSTDINAVRYHLVIDFKKKARNCEPASEKFVFGDGLEVSFSGGGGGRFTNLERHVSGAYPEHHQQQELEATARMMRGAQMYRFDATLMAVPAAISEKRRFRMDRDGFGLPSLLDELLGYDPEIFLDLSRQFCEFFPQFSKLRVEPEPGAERHYNETGIHSTGSATGKGIYFETTGGNTVRAQQASDGAILFLGFLALAYLPKPPKLLLIEEPENGIYPKRLEEVIGLLRELHDKPRGIEFPQIVLTTHSPYLLSQFGPEEVTFLARQPDGSVRAFPLRDVPNIKERLDGFYLGELWYNLTEDELLNHVAN